MASSDILYRDNVAIVQISVESVFADKFEMLREKCKSTRLVISNADAEVVFDKSWNWLQTTIELGFKVPGIYQIMVELKDGYGYINAITKQLEVKALQANFNLAVKDNTRWPLTTKVGSTLKETAKLLANNIQELSITGMPNATLYYSTKSLQQVSLAIPAIDSPNFEIAKFDAANPGDTVVSKHVKDLSDAKSDILTLLDLKDISLVNSQSMRLPQYGANYLELQFDIELMLNKFDMTLSATKYGAQQSMQFDFVDANDLLAKLVDNIRTHNLDLFDKFTWSLQEVYDTVEADIAHWQLFALSKEPTSLYEFWMSGDCVHEPIMIVDYVWLTDNTMSTCILTANESLTSTTATFNIELAGDIETFETTFGSQNAKDMTNLVNQLTSFFDRHLKTLQVVKAFVDDSNRIKKLILYAASPLKVDCSGLIGQHLYDVERYTKYDSYAAIEQGSTITVGSSICCIPDEKTWAFEPYDLQWSVIFDNTVVATSNKWLLKHHVKQIGSYDIQLDIIDPMTLNVIKRLNKSVTVAKA